VSVGAVIVLAGKPFITTMVISLVNANVIGVGFTLVFPPLKRWLAAHGGGPSWLVVPTILLGMAAFTALMIGLGATWLGWLPSARLWQVVWPSLGIAAVVAVSLGVAIALHESTRAERAEATAAQQTAELARAEATLAQQTAELAQARAEQLATETRLASLEARLEPHFLFNTLNTIVGLIHEDPVGAAWLVRRLAALLHLTLDHRDQRTVRLDTELEVARNFLEIQTARFERLTWAIEVPTALGDYDVPPFALQTVVENSVLHVAERRPEPTRLRITAGVEGSALELRVWDDGPGFSLGVIPRGRGLDTLRQRLDALYGAEAGLKVERREEGTLVTIRLPVCAPGGRRS
jgi:LytS/YehU family sensor histidine kinase